jgi:hypothetical protein
MSRVLVASIEEEVAGLVAQISENPAPPSRSSLLRHHTCRHCKVLVTRRQDYMVEFAWINKQGVRSDKGFVVQREEM